MSKQYLKLYLVVLSFIIVVAGCNFGKDNLFSENVENRSKLVIVTTTYPIYEFTKQVGGDKVNVIMLIPPGVEVHHWEPTPKDLIFVRKADLFIYNGLGLEPTDKIFTKDILGKVKLLRATEGIEYNENNDPHIWLNPLNSIKEVMNIAKALMEIDVLNKDYYLANAQKYCADLLALDQETEELFKNAINREFVVTHKAYTYFAQRYNLAQIPLMGINADAEVAPEEIVKVIKLCKDRNIKYIYVEPFVTSKLAETVAQEIEADILPLYPLDGISEAEFKAGKSYLDIMKQNAMNLHKTIR